MSQFESVGQILPRTIKKKVHPDNLLALRVKENFAKVLTAIFADKKMAKVAVGKFSYGTLNVSVPDPAWAQALREKERLILKNINSLLGGKIVEKLRFRIGRI